MKLEFASLSSQTVNCPLYQYNEGYAYHSNNES